MALCLTRSMLDLFSSTTVTRTWISLEGSRNRPKVNTVVGRTICR